MKIQELKLKQKPEECCKFFYSNYGKIDYDQLSLKDKYLVKKKLNIALKCNHDCHKKYTRYNHQKDNRTYINHLLKEITTNIKGEKLC